MLVKLAAVESQHNVVIKERKEERKQRTQGAGRRSVFGTTASSPISARGFALHVWLALQLSKCEALEREAFANRCSDKTLAQCQYECESFPNSCHFSKDGSLKIPGMMNSNPSSFSCARYDRVPYEYKH